MARRAIHTLRALLPSWRFFDRTSPTPQLWLRTADGCTTRANESISDATAEQPTWSAWQAWQAPAPRAPLRLLHHPYGNLRLAYVSLFERLIDELSALQEGDSGQVEQLVSYGLVDALVRRELRGASTGTPYQFKLTLFSEAEDTQVEDVLVSSMGHI